MRLLPVCLLLCGAAVVSGAPKLQSLKDAVFKLLQPEPESPTSDCDLAANSSLTQSGGSAGNAHVAASASTSGSASSRCIGVDPSGTSLAKSSAISGVRGAAASSGEGAFEQEVKSGSEVATTGGDDITVTSESSGEGRTAGKAAVSQESLSEADIDVLRLSKILLRNGREAAVVEEEGTGTANSRSEHQADSERGGEFVFEQKSNTTIEQAIGLAKSG